MTGYDRRTAPARPGEWPPHHAGPGLPQLLTDDPTGYPQIENLFEQNSIAEGLVRTVAGHLGKAPVKDGPNHLFIALHGRLGQGKSRAIRRFRDTVDWRRVGSGVFKRPVRVFEFRCSDYPPSDLLNDFDIFLESRRSFAVLAIVVVLGVLLATLLGRFVEEIPKYLVYFSVAVPAAMVAATGRRPLWHLLQDTIRALRIGRSKRKILRMVCDRLFVTPDIIIVDDLDRARVEQQAALLKSLNRHRDEIGAVVIVVFDDSDLVSSSDPHGAESEMMSKIFDVSFRLSPMNAHDAGVMASAYSAALADTNPDCRIARIFNEPVIAGGLARIFRLHGNASARFAKKLINNTYTQARLYGFEHGADILALIRLHGIYRYLPVVETELETFTHSMIASSEDLLFKDIEHRFGSALGPELKAALKRLIQATKHMQPTNFSWRRSARIWRDPTTRSATEGLAPPGWSADWTLNWALNEAYVVGLYDPAERRKAYADMDRAPGHALFKKELASKATERADGWPEPPIVQASMGRNSEFLSYWQALVDSMRVFDTPAFALMSQREREEIMQRHRSRPLAKLVFSTAKEMRFSDARMAWRHTLHSSEANIRDRLAHELNQNISPDMADSPVIAADAPLSQTASQILPDQIDTAWPELGPPSSGQNLSAQEKNSFEQLGLVLADLPRDFSVMPKAHMAWFANALDTRSFAKIRRGLATIHDAGIADDGHIWFVGAVERFWRDIPEPEAVAEWFANRLLSGDAAQFDAWALATFLGMKTTKGAVGTTSILDRMETMLTARTTLPTNFFPDAPRKLSYLPVWHEELDPLVAIWPACAVAARTWTDNNVNFA